MAEGPGRGVERLDRLPRLPWPARLVVGALAVVGAITLVQWVLAVFAWLIMLLTLVAVLVGLVFWVASERRRH